MDVLVAGGTGFVGRNLCAELLERGHDVTALARDPDADDLPEGVATVAGDVTNYESIADAFAGRDAVVNLVALSPLFEPAGGNAMHETVHLGGTENCVEAAESHDVERVVQMSGLGAAPDARTHFLRAKGRAEAVVRESSLDWVIVRPSVIFGDGGEFVGFTKQLTTPYVTGLPGGGSTPFQPIHVGDVATILAAAVEDDEHVGATYEVGGPEVLTMAEVARMAYRADGRSLRVIPVPMALAGVGLTVAGAVPGVPFGGDQYRSLKIENTVADNDVDAFGLAESELQTLGAYLGLSGP
jgi:NADH dehydrogenase